MKGILLMLPMFISQLTNQEKSYVVPMATTWLKGELKRVNLSKTDDQVAAFVDFAVDLSIAEEVAGANLILARVNGTK